MTRENGSCACGAKLSEAEVRDKVLTIIEKHKQKQGALIPILQETQMLFGYLPESALKVISKELQKPYSEVAGVVGFYSFFSTVPRGRHLIRVCLGTACYVRGGKKVLDSLKKNLEVEVGGTTSDNLFSVEVARCFGACGLAPTMMVDNEVHQRVKPMKIAQVLEKYRINSSTK